MEIRSIKNVDKETWRKFKELSIKNKLNMSILLKMMVKEFEKRGEGFWRELLGRGKTLTDSEADDMLDITKKVRNERGFRE